VRVAPSEPTAKCAVLVFLSAIKAFKTVLLVKEGISHTPNISLATELIHFLRCLLHYLHCSSAAIARKFGSNGNGQK
jgi:hypothetical protein